MMMFQESNKTRDRFLFEGKQIRDEDTASSIEMENGEAIYN
jgi:hypothetical protein